MEIYDLLAQKIKAPKTIVFPEGDDPRILGAARRLSQGRLIKPLLLSAKKQSGIETIAPKSYLDKEKMISVYLDARRQEGQKQAEKAVIDPNYFGVLLVKMGLADGMVSGAAHSTADTVRPALKIIKTAPDFNRVSGSFIMEKGKQRYVFADCAINIDPNAATLAEIGYQSALTAELAGLTPRLAFLSFSTKGSASAACVDKVKEASRIFARQHPDIPAAGELQFDAALVPAVAAKKAPGSKVAGHANVFIFPELQSGNIGYKIAQRLAGFSAVGPILQGLARPVNDLSRGANTEDVYDAAILTAAQASGGQVK